MSMHRCLFCSSSLQEVFADLGMSPLSNAFVSPEHASEVELFFPLTAYVCHECLLVQVPQFEVPERIFSDTYAYFSSFSDTWLAHVRQYVDEMIARYHIGPSSHAIEIASNDGYLLQYFGRPRTAHALRRSEVSPRSQHFSTPRPRGNSLNPAKPPIFFLATMSSRTYRI